MKNNYLEKFRSDILAKKTVTPPKNNPSKLANLLSDVKIEVSKLQIDNLVESFNCLYKQLKPELPKHSIQDRSLEGFSIQLVNYLETTENSLFITSQVFNSQQGSKTHLDTQKRDF